MTGFIIILIIVLIALAFLLYPGKLTTKNQNADKFIGVSYAHRGLHNLDAGVPENSLKAFERACAFGYGIELDVRLSADNKVMVFHDDTLKRMCGRDVQFIDLTEEELSKIRLLNTDQTIPSFEDVLSVIDKNTPVIVELKTVENYELLCKQTYEMLKAHNGTYCVESFDPRIVSWFKKNAPEIIRGQLSANLMNRDDYTFALKFMLTNLLSNFLARPHFIAYSYKHMDNIFYLIATRIFKAIPAAWTVRDEKVYNAIKDQCDVIIFEGFKPEPKYK